MPYEIKKVGAKYEVINKETRESKGKSDSKEKAIAHMRRLYMVEGLKK